MSDSKCKKNGNKKTQSWRRREAEDMETKEREIEREIERERERREIERNRQSGRMMVQRQNETKFKTMNFIFQE